MKQIRNLVAAYRKMQPPVKASFWFLLCGFMQKGISMLTTPVFTRIMTEAEYGRYNVYNSWMGIVQIIVSLNLAASVYTRGLVKNEDDQDRFSSSMLGLSTTCILFWCGIYALFRKTINEWTGLSTLLMVVMMIDIWSHAAYQFWSNRERVHYRYKKLVILTITYVILRPLLSVICVLKADVLHQVEARVLMMVLVNTILFSGLYYTILKKGKQFFNKKYWVYALRFNIPLIPHYLSQVVLNQSDRLMINNICGPQVTAYYSVAYTIAMVLQILNNSVSATMNPWIYKTIKKGDLKKIGSVSYMILLVIGLLNIAVILMAPEILWILAPGRYQTAKWVIPPVTASVYFMFLYNLFATFEFYFEKTHYVTTATMLGAVLNVLLNAWMIPQFGFVAAGYTTLLCYILYAIAHYYFMKKVCKEYLDGFRVYDARIILGIGAGLLLISLVIMFFYNTVVIRYGLLLCLGAFVLLKRWMLIGLLKKLKQG